MRTLPFKLTTIFLIALIATGCASASQLFLVLDSATDQPIAGADAHITNYGTAPGFGHPTSLTLLDRQYQTDQHGEFSVLSPWAKDAHVSLSKEGYVQIQTAKELRRNQEKGAALIYLYLTPKSDVTIETINFSVALGEKLLADKTYLFGYSRIVMEYGHAKNIAKSENELLAVKSFCRFAHGMKSQIEQDPRDHRLGERLESAQELVRDCQEAQ